MTTLPAPYSRTNAGQWQLGQSGNPAGRPRGARALLSERVLRALADDFRYPVTVVGEVDMWGLVMEHEHGYRAQYARPRAFLKAKGRNAEAALAELRSCFDV